jgi:hypothetical protein
MSGKRKEAEAFWLDLVTSCNKNTSNIDLYKHFFKSLSDKDFKALMDACDTGGTVLPYYVPNNEEDDVDIATCLKVGKKLDIEFFQRLIQTSPITGVKHMTPTKFFIIRQPVRRPSQFVTKAKSVAENVRFVDNLSGQAIGISKTAKQSLPELLNLDAQGLHHGVYEMMGVRGGNIKGLREAKRRLINDGAYSLEDIKSLGHRAESLETAKTILRGMMFKCNL